MSSTSRFTFAPALKQQLKARLAFDGPTGSGKTWTMLAWATALAEAEREAGLSDGRIAVVDTERGSARLYADRYSFDVLEWQPPYDPRELTEALREADRSYDVICTDSLTHFWKGEGGTMDIVDGAAARQGGGNAFAGWKVGTPALRGLIDTMLGLDAHFLATMRSKMEHILVEDSRGRKVPQRVGLSPEMRADIEYEFTAVISMDLDHRGTVTKSRAEALADKVIAPGSAALADAADAFIAWLNSGEAAPDLASPDQIAAWREWISDDRGHTRAQRYGIRDAWPMSVPAIDAPGFTTSHLEHLVATTSQVLGENPPPDLAARLAGHEPDPADVQASPADEDAPAGDGEHLPGTEEPDPDPVDPPEPSTADGDYADGEEPFDDDLPDEPEFDVDPDDRASGPSDDPAPAEAPALPEGIQPREGLTSQDVLDVIDETLTEIRAMAPKAIAGALSDADLSPAGSVGQLVRRLAQHRLAQLDIVVTQDALKARPLEAVG